MTAELHCMDALDFLRSQPAGSVSLIATDPPYFRVKGEAWDNAWDDSAAFLRWVGELCGEWRRVLAPNGSLYVFASPEMDHGVESVIRNYFRVLTNVRWRKPPFSTKAEMFRKEDLRAPFPASESIIFAEQVWEWPVLLQSAREQSGLSRQEVSERVVGSRSGASWNWEAGIRLPEPHHWAALRDLFPSLPPYDAIARPYTATECAPYTDVWDFGTVSQYPGKHPCEKPLALMEHIIRTSSRPGDLVLDCFLGSGTTALAAQNLGRRFIGCDESQHWVNWTRQRLAQIGLQLDGAA